MALNSKSPIVIALCVIPSVLCGGCCMLGFISAIVNPTPKTAEQLTPTAKQQPVAATRVDQPPPPKRKEETFKRSQFFPADYLGRQFDSNALKAEKDFNGVRIPVTGIVESVNSDILGTPYVSLKAENLLGVQCMFPRDMADDLGNLTKGQTVFIAGTCKGRTLGIVVIDDCRFIQPLP